MGIQKEEIESIITEVDTDGDGEIDFEEFMAMIRKCVLNCFFFSFVFWVKFANVFGDFAMVPTECPSSRWNRYVS